MSVAATTLLTGFLSAISKAGGERAIRFLGKAYKNNEIKKLTPSLYERASSIRKVKTIWQIDRAIDLHTFYYPARLTNEFGNSVVINSIEDIPYEENRLIVQGTVGHGKSILLRYLGSTELERGKSIPLFIELKKIAQDKNVRQLLLDKIEALGFERSDEMLDIIMRSGKAIILLDAFDEIQEAWQQKAVDDIEHLIECYQDIRFILTTRPKSIIVSSTFFRVIEIEKIGETELPQIINKLMEDDYDSKVALIDSLGSIDSNVKAVLSTPLLVALFVLSYKANNRIPETVVSFYEDIFDCLLRRHDGTKTIKQRDRHSDLSDTDFRKVFEKFCFETRRKHLGPIKKDIADELVRDALKYSGLNCKPDDYIKDLKNITCLLLEEGDHYDFVHKSVQEFYSASFISKLSIRPQFYEKCKNGFLIEWLSELNFLSNIDKKKYYEEFALPLLNQLISIAWNFTTDNPDDLSDDGINKLISDITIIEQIPNSYITVTILPYLIIADQVLSRYNTDLSMKLVYALRRSLDIKIRETELRCVKGDSNESSYYYSSVDITIPDSPEIFPAKIIKQNLDQIRICLKLIYQEKEKIYSELETIKSKESELDFEI